MCQFFFLNMEGFTVDEGSRRERESHKKSGHKIRNGCNK